MSDTSSFVIVGAGLAGAKAAETLRAEGYEGRLLLLGDEAERPYERPPLSKAYLRGETDRDSLYVHQEGFYAAHDIELRPSTPVRSIDPTSRQLELKSGERIRYERLLLATGAASRRLPLPRGGPGRRPLPAQPLRAQHGVLSGFAPTWDRVVVRGDPATRQFIAFWLKDQRVVAGMNAGVWDVTEPIRALIRGGLPVDPARLADPDIPLDQVTGEDTGQRSDPLATRSAR